MLKAPADRILQQAIALHQAGRAAEAVPLYEQVLRKDSRASGVLNLLGLAQFQLGNLPQAGDALRRAIKLNPEIPSIDYNLGRVLQAQARFKEALAHYEKAVARAPSDAEALNNLGSVLAALERPTEAIPIYQRAAKIAPDFPDVWFNLGNAFEIADRYIEAAAAYERVVALRPDHAEALGALALTLNELDRQDDAITVSKRAIAYDPDKPGAYFNLARALDVAGEDAPAEEAYAKAQALDPNSADTMWNKALFAASRGRFAEAWPLFHHRWEAIPTLVRRDYKQPRWNGEKVTGTLLVWAEQGLGDQIFYTNMVRDLPDRADKVVLEVDQRLVTLLTRSLPGITVVAKEATLYAGDVTAQIAMGDLGRYINADHDAVLARSNKYLLVDTVRAAELRSRLANDGRHVVGLSWGSINPKIGQSKSARLAEFLPILRLPNCRFIDLQYGDTKAEREDVQRELGVKVEHLDDIDTTNDIEGLAALMSACDAVVSISNTNAHLAAALGRPTFILLSSGHGLLWYWMKRGGETPFYASARLYRQDKGRSWPDLTSRMAPELSEFLAMLPR